MKDEPSRELSIFDAALGLPDGEQAALLERECGDDHPLRARVERLLSADAELGNFMQELPGRPELRREKAIDDKRGVLEGHNA